jgi:hypothetical protein
VKHKGSWVNLDLGCGLAALSPLLPHQEVTALLRHRPYSRALFWGQDYLLWHQIELQPGTVHGCLGPCTLPGHGGFFFFFF